MTFPRLAALHCYWQTSPPVHILVKAYMGIKTPAPGEIEEQGDVEEAAGEVGLPVNKAPIPKRFMDAFNEDQQKGIVKDG
jgi:hypothetical protein